MSSTLAPPRPAGSSTFDFAKAFTFVFQDPDWVKKTLLGGLFYMLSFVLIGLFIVMGYLAQLARNVAAGMERPLPEWDRIGEYLVDGLKLLLVTVVWWAPLILLTVAAVVPISMLENSEYEGPAAALLTCGVLVVVLVSFVLAVFFPAALLLVAVRGKIAAGFEFGTIFRFVKVNALNYVLAIVVYLITNTLSGLGILLLCVGVFFTTFLSLVMTTWAFGETYRLSPMK